MVLTRDGESDLQLQPGEIAIYDTAVPYELYFYGQWDCIVMTVSREELSLPSRTLNNAFRQYFPSLGAGSVLTQLIESSIFNNVASRESSEFLGHAAIDLLAGLSMKKPLPMLQMKHLEWQFMAIFGRTLDPHNLRPQL